MEPEQQRATPNNVAIEIHFHINGPVVMGVEVVGAMMPALMQILDSAAKQPIT